MNFKLILIVLLLPACGVKGPPRPPADSIIPPLIKKYHQDQPDPKTKKKEKKE